MEIGIGKKISAWRKERGFTQAQLAEKSNISRSYLAGVETGRYNPSIDTLKNIAKSLNINISFLLEDTKQVNEFLEWRSKYAKDAAEIGRAHV